MIKVLVACGNGVGSSLMLKMKVDNVLKEMGEDYVIDHFSVGEAKGKAKSYDYIIVSETFSKEFDIQDSQTKVISLQNILSDDEIKEKLKKAMED